MDASGEVLDPFLRDKRQFREKVVATRNYLVHSDPELREKSARPDELWQYTFVLSMLMRAILLGVVMNEAERGNRIVVGTPEYWFQTRRIKLP